MLKQILSKKIMSIQSIHNKAVINCESKLFKYKNPM